MVNGTAVVPVTDEREPHSAATATEPNAVLTIELKLAARSQIRNA